MRMKTLTQALGGILAFSPWLAFAFNSGSTGADGAFSPTVSQEVVLPPSGVFNFTNVNIPAGVTITFKKNAANTPVVMLASGDFAISGTLDVSGKASANVGAAGNGSIGDDGTPGAGGPSGFGGGRGGQTGSQKGGAGLGPGSGGGGALWYGAPWARSFFLGGGAGGFGTAGGAAWVFGTYHSFGAGGAVYGSNLLLPLIGGSGGGGGTGGLSLPGGGGGGGGGAVLIAASGTINVTGSVLANGGASGAASGSGTGGTGGGGSGGSIRLVATTVSGNGTIAANGGTAGASAESNGSGGAGGVGRIRIEAETLSRTAASVPVASVDAPGQIFVAGLPTLSITSVAGVAPPANPTGNADITLPVSTSNPVTVEFRTTNVPVGNIVKLTVTPAYGDRAVAYSPALVGSTESAAASAQITLPTGPSTLQAETTYTIVASLGDALSRYANNERVDKVQLSSVLGGKSTVTLITVSGKEYEIPAALFAIMAS